MLRRRSCWIHGPKTWRDDLISSFGLPRKIFGECFQPGHELGKVQPSVASETGLEDVPVIVPATHDTASAVIAVPANEFAPEQPNWCYISSGTWSLMGCELPQPKINAKCAELNFTNEGGVLGSTRLLKNIGGLWIFQQIRKSLERRGEDESWESMVESASRSTPFALLIDPDAADFVAPDDMVDAIATYASRTGQGAAADRGVLYRAALEGLALRYRVCLGMLESLVEHRIDVIHIVGGGSQNALVVPDDCRRVRSHRHRRPGRGDGDRQSDDANAGHRSSWARSKKAVGSFATVLTRLNTRRRRRSYGTSRRSDLPVYRIPL